MSNNVPKLRKVAICGLMAAFVFVATQIRIPTAIGYINLGDPVILISSFILGPIAFFPAAIGSALSDLLAGYAQYIIPTFIAANHKVLPSAKWPLRKPPCQLILLDKFPLHIKRLT